LKGMGSNDPMPFVRSGPAGTLSKSAADARLIGCAVLHCFRGGSHSLMHLCFCVKHHMPARTPVPLIIRLELPSHRQPPLAL
jgi:hypothetical protein